MQPTERHLSFMNELKASLANHSDLKPDEMLAIASQFVGNLIALQDQNKYTGVMAMQLVARNIEVGNAAVVETLLDTKGSA